MIPGAFTYLAPQSFPEVFTLLAEHGDDAKVLAGGQSLIPMMRFRLAEPKYLIDISRLPGLDGIAEEDGILTIGALVRESDLDHFPGLRERYPIVADTAAVIADPLVRNMATVGGNLAHGDPANDHPATMIALRAEIVVTSTGGERVIPIDDFFIDILTTALEPGELLTAIRIPAPRGRSGGAYVKFERKFGDYAIAAAAVQVRLDEAGVIEEVGIGLTNVASRPMRAAAAEATLRGRVPDDGAIGQAAAAAAQECDPSSDLRGSADYKRAMVRTMTARALHAALERAG